MLKAFFKDAKEYMFFCRYMAKTSLKAEVANSYLNWIWWVLEPIASMLVYYVIFFHILGRGQQYYIVFIYTGQLVWSYFDRCMLFDVQAIRLNRDIVTKIYVPKPMLLLSNMLFNSFKMLISVGILVILMIFQKVPPTPYILFVIPMLLVLQLLTFGFGLILMHFGVFVDDLAHAMRIFLHVVFYLTGVFYDLESILPGRLGGILVRINPMASVIRNLRQALLYGQAPDILMTLVWAGIGCLLCLIGLHLSYKYENTYVKII